MKIRCREDLCVRRLGSYVAVPLLAAVLAACTESDDPINDIIPPDDPDPQVEAVTIEPDSALLTEAGSTEQFSATAVDENGGALQGIDFEWSTSDASVATVSQGGLATAEGEGEAEIVVSAQGMADTAELVVDTTPEIFSVAVTPSSVTIEVGETVTLAASVDAEEGANTEVEWSSSNPSIASVDGDGNVTGQSTGSTTVIATSVVDESKSAAAEVTSVESS